MKQPPPTTARRERGSALILGLVVLIVIAGLAAAFMESSTSESRFRSDSAHRTRALYIAETGANRSVQDILDGGNGSLGSKSAQIPFGGGEFYVIATPLGDDVYNLLSISNVAGQRRAIEVVVAPVLKSLFTHGLFGDLDLRAEGNVFVDSYDADLGTYASQAVNYHSEAGHAYAMANGSLGSNSNIAIGGDVIVLGDVNPGPEGTLAILDDTTYISGSTEPAPEVRPLPEVLYEPPVATLGNFPKNGEVILTESVYRYTNFDFKGTLRVQGDVTLYVDDVFSVSSTGSVIVEAGSSLIIRHGGTDFDLTGQGVLNETQLPRSLRIYSTAETVKFAGTSGFFGAIYAPLASVSPVGTTDIHGAVLGSVIQIAGTANFHYDEALARVMEPFTSMKRVSWRRVAVPVDG